MTKGVRVTTHEPVNGIDEICKQYDEIAEECKISHPEFYKDDFDWRVQGATSHMSIEFAKRYADTGNQLNIMVIYKGRKIAEMLCGERNTGQISTLVLQPFGDHAMYNDSNLRRNVLFVFINHSDIFQ